ncbi:hypothetical protein BJ978_001557 [Agromyces terreus]|uniref:S1 motif domain-containing protein n=1 Tax=Agromyces terreus TaxID=424795 RepID=A0A9X2H0E5_9MICO|nr:hypothetical protein [Agromyces terreus]MCP2370881.1 hypothetical protein [Agromyces terreus]
MTYTRVDTVSAVTDLARGLFDRERDRPWVVVTSAFGAREPELDVDDLVAEVGDVSRVFAIETGDLTRELSRLLPDRLDVYGGAGRSYPIGFDPATSTSESRLRFPLPTAALATDRLITDVLAHANAAGLFESTQLRAVAASGTVTGILADGSRAIVDLGEHGMATVWQELTYPPVPLDWTLAKGQPVAGLLDAANRRLNVELETPDVAMLAARFPHREVTLALVEATSDQRATMSLHPRVRLEITREDVTPNPLDRVDSLLSVGDVVPVRVLHLSGDRLHLSLFDVDDDEPILPALALVDGGPPWLREDRPLIAVDDEPLRSVEAVELPTEPTAAAPVATAPGASVGEVPDVVAAAPSAGGADAAASPMPNPAAPVRRPMPGPGLRRAEPVVVVATSVAPIVPDAPAPAEPRGALAQSQQLTITRLQGEVAELTARLRDAGADSGSHAALRNQALTDRRDLRDALAELGELRSHARDLDDQLRAQRRQLRESRRMPAASDAPRIADRRAQWLDADDWVRHEILLAWVDRVPPSDRASHALPGGYVVRPGFAESLERLDDGQLAKALKATVDVLVGRAGDISARRLHPLRTGDGATAADVIRSDGARCYRASIEQNTPAARRLHYWVLPDGTIELSRVVTHDEMEP